MSLRLEIKKVLVERSPRVKALDFHNENCWILLGLYSGTLALHDYSTNSCIRTLQASVAPIRAVRFICSKQQMVCGSDDFMIRVFNYNTMEKVKEFQGSQDFIRCIIVHPTQPYMISGSDDAKIKIWNYDQNFALVRTLEEHKHFILGLTFNPRDLSKFGSCSMDKTIKIWNLTTEGKANLTLTGHKSGVDSIDFYKGDKPHLASGSDDRTIKIWDYQTRQCLNTIQCHAGTVTSVSFHPQLPLLFSTGEEGTVVVHHSNSYTQLNTLQYNLERSWICDTSKQNPNILGFGFDQGMVIVRIGSDDPIVSINNGKIIWTKNMQVFGGNLKAVNLEESPSGQKVRLSQKEIGSIDIYPTYLKHSPNGHHFGICNQKEFVIIKTASFKSVCLGNGTSLIWQNDTDFAVLDNDTVNIYQNFQSTSAIKVPFVPNRIFQGTILGIAGNQKIIFYEWDRLSAPVNSLDIKAQKVWWNNQGTVFAVASQQKMIIFGYNKGNGSFTELLTIADKVTSAVWVNQIFFYMNSSGKIFFSFRGRSFFYANTEKKRFILGVVEQQNRLYLFDRTHSAYSLHIQFGIINSVIDYINGKTGQLPEIPFQLRDRMAKCLNAFNNIKEAYKIVENQDHKFQLALDLGLVREAYKIACQSHSNDKIKHIGDSSLRKGDIELAIECYQKINDLNSLLLIYSTLSLPDKLLELGQRAQRLTKMNIAYMCFYLTNQPSRCVDVLIRSKRFSQAALFSRSYCNDRVSQCVKLWKQSLNDKTLADKISDPNQEQQDQEADNQDKEDENQEVEQQS